MEPKPGQLIAEHKFACLTYHILGEQTREYTISEKHLRAQLEFLRAGHYVAEGFEQLAHRLSLTNHWPNRYVVLTVDDGHESAMRMADLLNEYGYQATFFLTRDRCLGKLGFIREPQIRELRKRNFSLGTHGTSHRKLTFLPEQRCLEELRESKRWLEDVIGEEVRYTAAPGGYINARVKRLAHGCGYDLTGTCNEWMNCAEGMTQPGEVNRVSIRRQFSIHDFRQIAEGHIAFYLWRQIRAAALIIPKLLIRD